MARRDPGPLRHCLVALRATNKPRFAQNLVTTCKFLINVAGFAPDVGLASVISVRG